MSKWKNSSITVNQATVNDFQDARRALVEMAVKDISNFSMGKRILNIVLKKIFKINVFDPVSDLNKMMISCESEGEFISYLHNSKYMNKEALIALNLDRFFIQYKAAGISHDFATQRIKFIIGSIEKAPATEWNARLLLLIGLVTSRNGLTDLQNTMNTIPNTELKQNVLFLKLPRSINSDQKILVEF
ncbi:MAG: hypothetical protein HY934_07030 [Candidatus Firestonebacteria bacterium]|nr:hypothetical protein [Candidatus Firestonebacteria bacterium]